MIKKKCLVAFDGLSTADLPHLLELLPKSKSALGAMSQVELVSSSTEPLAIWAEILTGEPWFENGCAGYSRPKKSLNELSVFSELDLHKNLRVLDDNGAGGITINLPLVHPSRAGRIWLSDGSLADNRTITPASLAKSEPFNKYKPRPIPSLAFAYNTMLTAQQFLSVASNQLECAIILFRDHDWHTFILRINVFDRLSHLFGLNFLLADNLRVFPALKQYLTQLDDALQLFTASEKCHVMVVSAFSHVTCNGTVNLNSALREGEFLVVDMQRGAVRSSHKRLNTATALFKYSPSKHLLDSTEGRLVLADSLACSPTAGAIFINAKRRFDSGCVSDSDYNQVRTDLREYLRDWLQAKYPGLSGAVFEENPKSLEEICRSSAPEFIVTIPGIEMTDLLESARAVPLTTHSPHGFVLLPPGTMPPHEMAPTDIVDYF